MADDDPIDLGDIVLDFEEDIDTDPGIGPPPEKKIEKAKCTACGSKEAEVLFSSVRCSNLYCRFYSQEYFIQLIKGKC